MGKKIDNSKIATNSKNQIRKIRMAYTLNNTQPVLCTMISDQPFFYIDEEIQGDDNCMFADEFVHEVEDAIERNDITDPSLINELLAMKNKIDAYESLTTHHKDIDSRDNILDIFKDDGQVILDADYHSMTKIENVIKLLQKSQTAKSYLDNAIAAHVKIEYSNKIEKAYFDSQAKLILISPNLSYTDQAILLVRELRRFWQNTQNAMTNSLDFDPDEAVLIHRAQHADLDGAVIKSAWELRLAGEFDLWDRLENSCYMDLARAFAREALSDFRTLNNGKAQAVLFETWFLSNRCTMVDKQLINMMLNDYKDYVQESQNEASCYDILCRLGELPMGKNYLSSYAAMIVNDSLFTEVRDRSNANFLWFIKFERNFAEAEQIVEQQLQSTDISKSGDSDLIKNKYIEDTSFNEKIHAFPCTNAKNTAPTNNIGEKITPHGNNVIYARFGKCGEQYGQS